MQKTTYILIFLINAIKYLKKYLKMIFIGTIFFKNY